VSGSGSGGSAGTGSGGSAGTGSGGSAGTGSGGSAGTGSGGAGGSSAGASGAAGTGTPPEPDPAAVAAAIANIDVNLERLRALSVVEVTGLVETGNCYGLPCPGEEPPLEARGKAALRLQELVKVAEFAVSVDYVAASCIERVDANLAALRGLRIVELGAFLRTQPANNPLCYNLPCTSDIDAAAVENEARAADLEQISIHARPL
jgi:hypothetical protein